MACLLAFLYISQGVHPNFVSRFRSSEPKFRPKFRHFMAKNCQYEQKYTQNWKKVANSSLKMASKCPQEPKFCPNFSHEPKFCANFAPCLQPQISQQNSRNVQKGQHLAKRDSSLQNGVRRTSLMAGHRSAGAAMRSSAVDMST